MTVHHCPRCELRFALRGDLVDHVRRDHPPLDPTTTAPAGVRIVVPLDPNHPIRCTSQRHRFVRANHGSAVERPPVRAHKALELVERAKRLEQMRHQRKQDGRRVHARGTPLRGTRARLALVRVGRGVGPEEEPGVA